MLQPPGYPSSGQVSLTGLPPSGPYSNYHAFAHLSDFCMPVNFDGGASVYANFGSLYNGYPVTGQGFGLKNDQSASSSNLGSYTNLDEVNKENIGPMRSRSSSLGQNPIVKIESTSDLSGSCKKLDFKSEDEEQRYRERRNKNNQAAKQSRCKRREREKNLQDRVKTLEQENEHLKQEIRSMRQSYNELLSQLPSNFDDPQRFLRSKTTLLEQKPPADPITNPSGNPWTF